MGKEEIMNEKEKHYFKILLPLVGVAILLVGYFIWQSGNVSNNGSRADAVRTELDSAGKLINSSLESARNAERGIEGAESAIRNSLERIEAIESRDTEIANRLSESLRINRSGQSIIQGVRKRGQENSE
jgi:hypothetical protein